MSVPPRLSVCMIARDEAEILAAALESVRGLADEIVVVDTGSVDDTVALARAHGARVDTIPWPDDFAAARNASLERATGDWILVLDADEVIEAADHATVRAALEGPPAGYALLQRNYVAESVYAAWMENDGRCARSAPWPGYVTASQIRLVPNRPDIRYGGAVHEDLSASLVEAGLPLRELDVPVHHFGKVRDEAVMARKKDLYTRLGERKVDVDPENAQALYELGVQYLELDRRAESLELFRRSLAADPAPHLEARAASFLGGVLADDGRIEEALEILGESLGRHPTSLHLHETRCRVLLAGERYAAAIDALAEATRLFPDQMHLRRVRAGLHLDLRQFDAARAELEWLADRVGDDPTVRRSLALVRVLAERKVALTSTDGRRRAEDAVWIARALAQDRRAEWGWRVLDALDPAERPYVVAARADLDTRHPEPWGAPALRRALRWRLPLPESPAAVAQRLLGRGDLAGGLEATERAQAAGDPAGTILAGALAARTGCPEWSRRAVETARTKTSRIFTV